jgi:activating signal cointegrator 1
MRAISLWQPWASAIAVGAKRVETRHWSTDYRGPLAIHAAKRRVVDELIHYHSCWNWQGAMRPLGWTWGNDEHVPYSLPLGAIVATCRLVDCRPTESFSLAELRTPRRPTGETSDLFDWTEEQMGNFALGRFGWVLVDIKALPAAIPFKGAQGFFNVPDELVAA